MFGDDALQRSLSAGREQGITITIEFIAELNATFSIVSNQTLQYGAALRESLLPEVFAFEVQNIEGV
jgi:hypothetical protein